MGAWGEGVFEDDAGGDWLDQLVAEGKPQAIDKALNFAVKAKPGRLEADEASAGLVAAEVVAARGHKHADLPDDVKEWLEESGWYPSEETASLAAKAAERIRDDSELLELWTEGDELPAWKRGVNGLLDRLAKPARPPSRRRRPRRRPPRRRPRPSRLRGRQSPRSRRSGSSS